MEAAAASAARAAAAASSVGAAAAASGGSPALLEALRCFICFERVQEPHLCPQCSKMCCLSCISKCACTMLRVCGARQIHCIAQVARAQGAVSLLPRRADTADAGQLPLHGRCVQRAGAAGAGSPARAHG